MIEIVPFNASYVKIRTSDFGIEQELAEFFTYMAPNHKFIPSFRSGMWDGKIRLFNMRTKAIYRGLIPVIRKFADLREYELKVPTELHDSFDITEEEVTKFVDSLNMNARGVPLAVRDYQYKAIWQVISEKRNIALAATSAGKSAIIYAKIRFHEKRGERTLLIVPTVNLVKQMHGDFTEYSSANCWGVSDKVSMLYSGQDRVFDSPVIISTWQSLAAMLKSDPKNFSTLVKTVDVIIGDESHGMKSDMVMKVLDSFVNTEWRTGTSGTLDGTTISELTLTGIFGKVYKIVSAKELMDAGQVTTAAIKVLILKHPEEYRKALKGMDYKEEIDQIVANPARNNFITNLTLACTGNTLVLFNFVQRQGQVLYDLISAKVAEGRNVYFIHGKVDVEERERIRKIVETEDNAIIIATSSLFSTGTNIPSLQNIIFTVAGKSNIRIRQSIGRGLRLKEGKTVAKIFDIADDYRIKSWTNSTYRHMEQRLGIYISEQFDYTVKEIELKY